MKKNPSHKNKINLRVNQIDQTQITKIDQTQITKIDQTQITKIDQTQITKKISYLLS